MAALAWGGNKLPEDLTQTAYLGNRCAEALFLTFVSTVESAQDVPGASGSLLTELKELDLSGQGLANEAAKALAELISYCPKLRVLNLSRNNISKAGARAILAMVAAHPTLEQVNLDGNPMPSWIRVHVKEIMKTREIENRREASL